MLSFFFFFFLELRYFVVVCLKMSSSVSVFDYYEQNSKYEETS